jgi:hypothetical protein
MRRSLAGSSKLPQRLAFLSDRPFGSRMSFNDSSILIADGAGFGGSKLAVRLVEAAQRSARLAAGSRSTAETGLY